MEPAQFVLPTIATLALGTAMLVPLRDDRRGKRATLGGATPLRPDFRVIASEPRAEPPSPETTSNDTAPRSSSSETAPPSSTEPAPTVIVESAGATRDLATSPGAARDLATPPGSVARQAESQEHEARVDSHAAQDATATPIARARDETVDRTVPNASELGETTANAPPQTNVPDTRSRNSRADAPRSPYASLLRRVRVFLGIAAITEKPTTADDRTIATHVDENPTITHTQARAHASERDEGDVTIERSFANELGLLLNPPRGAARSFESSPSGSVADAQHVDLPLLDTPLREPSLPKTSLPETSHPSESRTIPSAVVARTRGVSDRVVPLTRLPLRPQAGDITWPSACDPTRETSSLEERHALLVACAKDPTLAPAGALQLAYAQEDRDGRLLALRAIAKSEPTSSTRATFVEALRNGGDDERSFAIDAIGRHGERDDLVAGLRDRVDAIAARAALAYVGRYERAAYRAALAPHLEFARIEAILILLAGLVE